MRHWDDDTVLRVVETLPNPIGSLASAFPGAAAAVTNQRWIDSWFLEQTQNCLEGRAPAIPKLMASAADEAVVKSLAAVPTTHIVRLLSITPHYFRGFRAGAAPINLEGSLVVIEGLNSSGKTSLSEALEWILTGALSRRSAGNPRELANCTANEFRPASESTWVECKLEVNGDPLTLRRVLLKDYTEAVESTANSVLYRDGRKLNPQEARGLLEELFAGVNPILMQHTLREFVCSTPAERRRYFERLLQIDELTALIERAVVGDSRLREFICPTATDGRRYFDALRLVCTSEASIKVLRELERAGSNAPKVITRTLLAVAAAEFGFRSADLPAAEREVTRLQEEERTRKFPVLQHLRIKRDAALPSANGLNTVGKRIKAAAEVKRRAEEAAEGLEAVEKIAAAAVQELVAIGALLAEPVSDSICPLCIDERSTLTPARVHALFEQAPITEALRRTSAALTQAEVEWKTELTAFLRAVDGWQVDVSDVPVDLTRLAADVRPVAEAALQTAAGVTKAVGTALALVKRTAPAEAGATRFHDALSKALALLDKQGRIHRNAVEALESALGAGALTEPSYAARAAWLDLVKHRLDAGNQLKWESALRSAQLLLVDIRKGLIELRGSIIEGARQAFTESMSRVWSLLRADPGGTFSKIGIPAPKGKGYKLELEVKAVLSDGKSSTEVDALRVFSESQVNVVGIAAYVTRAAALGHTVVVFDDPVQSMDEEHFKSLAGKLIPELVQDGRQVIVLTHSESFARDISHMHFQRSSYATLRTRYSRRKGCWVEEGSRRVAERLNAAEKLMEDGQLEEGWNRVRLALERLYTVAMKAANPEFEPDQWRNLTAEDMWGRGVDAVITTRVVGSGERLKDILRMTAMGAHDAVASSATDLSNAISYIRTLLTPLRLGAG